MLSYVMLCYDMVRYGMLCHVVLYHLMLSTHVAQRQRSYVCQNRRAEPWGHEASARLDAQRQLQRLAEVRVGRWDACCGLVGSVRSQGCEWRYIFEEFEGHDGNGTPTLRCVDSVEIVIFKNKGVPCRRETDLSWRRVTRIDCCWALAMQFFPLWLQDQMKNFMWDTRGTEQSTVKPETWCPGTLRLNSAKFGQWQFQIYFQTACPFYGFVSLGLDFIMNISPDFHQIPSGNLT